MIRTRLQIANRCHHWLDKNEVMSMSANALKWQGQYKTWYGTLRCFSADREVSVIRRQCSTCNQLKSTLWAVMVSISTYVALSAKENVVKPEMRSSFIIGRFWLLGSKEILFVLKFSPCYFPLQGKTVLLMQHFVNGTNSSVLSFISNCELLDYIIPVPSLVLNSDHL